MITKKSISQSIQTVTPDVLTNPIKNPFTNYVYLTCDIPNMSVPELIERYESTLIGLSILRALRRGVDMSDKVVDSIWNCIEWLRSTDFYTAPASTIYHDSYPSGLLIHSLRVMNESLELHGTNKFTTTDIDSVVLVALTHDWCKIGLYEQYSKNVKDPVTGQWSAVPAYKTKASPFPFGHGVSSCYLVSKRFSLTAEEFAAIRWHMGTWRVVDSEINELQACNEKYPLVHLIQFADQLSIVQYS